MWRTWLTGWGIVVEVGTWVRRVYARSLQVRVYCWPAIRRILGRPCSVQVWFRGHGRGSKPPRGLPSGSADTASMFASCCPFSAPSCWIFLTFHPHSNNLHPAGCAQILSGTIGALEHAFQGFEHGV